MKPRHLMLGAALLGAAGLALFGDKTPSGEVAEAVDRPAAPRAAARPSAESTSASAKPQQAAASEAASAKPAPVSAAALAPAPSASGAAAPAGAAMAATPSPSASAVAPSAPTTAESAPPAASVARGGGAVVKTGSSAILRLIPRAQLIGEAGEASFKSGEGVFLGQNWNPPPPPPVAPPPPPPPSAPPLPYSYIGKSVADGAWEVYLARGDRTYIVQLKTVLDGTYRVDKIAPPELTITYLPLNQVQQLNIGAID